MTPAFNEVIHAPNRLRICAFLDATGSAEFGALRTTLDVADSVVSKHLKVLQGAGYVSLTKPVGSGRVRTWVQLTAKGRRAYRSHVEALRALVEGSPQPALAAEDQRDRGRGGWPGPAPLPV